MDVVSFTWRIPDFLELRSVTERRAPIYSPKYPFEDHEWKIIMFPRGNNESDQTAVFLKWIPRGAKSPAVKFALMMRNHLVPSDYVASHFDKLHRFDQVYSDWGWDNFCSQETIKPGCGYIDIADGSISLQLIIASSPTSNITAHPEDIHLIITEPTDVMDSCDLLVIAGEFTFHCHRRLFNVSTDKVVLPDTDVFEMIYAFIYTGHLSIKLDSKLIKELIITADKFNLNSLIDLIPLNERTYTSVLNAAMATGNIELKQKCSDYIIKASGRYNNQWTMFINVDISPNAMALWPSVASLLVIISELVKVHADDPVQAAVFSRDGPIYPQYPPGALPIGIMNKFIVEWVHCNDGSKYIQLLLNHGVDKMFQRVDPTGELEVLYADDPAHDDIMKICKEFVSGC